MSNIGIQESATSQNRDAFKLSRSAVYVKRDGLLTSVVMARQNTARIAVLGTNRGQVTKVCYLIIKGSVSLIHEL